jgi:hypothetical protein
MFPCLSLQCWRGLGRRPGEAPFFRNGLAALGVGLSVREVIGYADAFTQVQNALRITVAI